MSTAIYTKIEIAREYIDLAMNLFLNDTNLFCAIHLAAAAEELFGRHLPQENNSHTRTWKAHKALEVLEGRRELSDSEAMAFINWPKNAVKHMRPITENANDTAIEIDPRREAEWLIERALSNLYRLKLPKSATLWRYEDHQVKRAVPQYGTARREA